MELKESAENLAAAAKAQSVQPETSLQNQAAMHPQTKEKIKILINKMDELTTSFIHGENHMDLANRHKENFAMLAMDFTNKLKSLENNQHQAKKWLIETVYLYKKLNRYIAKDNVEWNEFKKNWGRVKNQIISDCHIRINPVKAVAAQLTSAKIPNFFLIKTPYKKTSNTYFEHIDNPNDNLMRSFR